MFIVVSPRSRLRVSYSFILYLILIARVENSGYCWNKVHKSSQSPSSSHYGDYSEKGAIMTHLNMAGDGDQSEASSGGQGDGASGQADSSRLKVVRRQWKAAITRHLGTLECLMAEDSYDEVLDRLKVIKNSFTQLETAHDAYINSLTTLSDDELLQNEQWLSGVQGNYTAGVRAARHWLKDNGQLLSVDVKRTVKCDTAPPPCNPVKSDNTESMLSIPKLELDKFDGHFVQASMYQIQLSAVITRSDVKRYCIHHCRNWGRLSSRAESTKDTRYLAITG